MARTTFWEMLYLPFEMLYVQSKNAFVFFEMVWVCFVMLYQFFFWFFVCPNIPLYRGLRVRVSVRPVAGKLCLFTQQQVGSLPDVSWGRSGSEERRTGSAVHTLCPKQGGVAILLVATPTPIKVMGSIYTFHLWTKRTTDNGHHKVLDTSQDKTYSAQTGVWQ